MCYTHKFCGVVLTTKKNIYYNCNACLQFVLKGVIMQYALLEIRKKGVIFHTPKVLVLAKIGGVFPPKKISEKGYLFSARMDGWMNGF